MSQERALVERIQEDDTDAFAEVMRLYVARLIRFAVDIVGSRDAAEDVVQGVFITVWESRAALDATRPLKPYLYRAVRNRALDERKAAGVRERYRGTAATGGVSEGDTTTTRNPEEGILDAATVQAAVEQIAERRREALRLRFEEGMTHIEIAEVLGVTPEAAKRLVSRAVADVREILLPDYR